MFVKIEAANGRSASPLSKRWVRKALAVSSGLAAIVGGLLGNAGSTRLTASDVLAFAALYGVTLLLSEQVSLGITIGLAQMIILAAYTSIGPEGMIVAACGGAILMEVGRGLFFRQLGLTRRSLSEALPTTLFNLGAAVGAALLAGMVYEVTGGEVPTMIGHLSDLVPNVGLYAASFGLRALYFGGLMALNQRRREPRSFRLLLRQLVITEVLAVPLSFLVSVIYTALEPLVVAALAFVVVRAALMIRALERTQQVLRSQISELALVNAFGHTIAANLSIDTLMENLYNQIKQLMNVEMFVVALYDASTDTMTHPYVRHFDEHLVWSPTSDGLSHYIARTRKPLLMRGNVGAQAAALGIPIVFLPIPVTFLGIPLIAYDRVVGTLSIESFSDPNAYSQTEIDLLLALAPQAAVAVRNADLYSSATVLARDLAQVNDVSRLVSSTLDLNIILQTLGVALRRISGTKKLAIFVRNDDARSLRLAFSTGLSADYTAQFQAVPLDDETGPAQVMRLSEALVITDVKNDPRARGWRTLAEMEGYQSLATIPLRTPDNPIGFLAIFYETPKHFSLSELNLLRTLANQVAAAVENARLLEKTGAQAADMAMLVDAMQSLSGALELKQIGLMIVNWLARTLHFDEATLLLWDNAGAAFIALDTFSSREARPALLDDPLLQGLAREPSASLLPRTLEEQALVAQLDVATMLAIPLALHSETAGLVLLGRTLPETLSVRERQLVDAFLSEAATILDNARLFYWINVELEGRIQQLSALEDVSRKISALIDLPSVIDQVIDAALQVTHADSVAIGLEEIPGQIVFSKRVKPDRGLDRIISIHTGISGRVMRTGQPALVADVRQDPDYVVALPGVRSEVCVPILLAGKPIGVLDLELTRLNGFTPSIVRFTQTLADHAAIAIEKTRLFTDIRRSSEQMQAILNSTRDGMMLVGMDGTLTRINPAAEHLLRHNLRDQLGHSLLRWVFKQFQQDDLIGYPIEAAKEDLRAMKHDPGRVTRYVYQITEIDGGGHDIEEIGLPVYDEAGVVVARLYVLRDISEERARERFRDEVTDMVVHDLRSPLASVITSLDMINTFVAEADATNATAVAGIASRNAADLILLVESILEIRRLENGLLALDQTVTALDVPVAAAISALEPTATESAIVLHYLLPSDLPPLFIDTDKLRRVFINLLDNAIKYTPAEGQVRIEVQALNGAPLVTVRVVDTGKGIAPEFRGQVFEKFTTLPGYALRGRRGIGLGLTFCRLTVEAHGGRIWVEDGPEGGAAICFTLPVAVESAD